MCVAASRLAARGVFVKRALDIAMAVAALVLLALPMLAVALWIRLTSPGPALYWSDRVGRNNVIFRMPKFRTMLLDTPPVPKHLLADPGRHLTPVGRFLRQYSLDELPQLFSILRGDMSFVGPRPLLFNHEDRLVRRTQKGIHVLMPGLTGWAQINGRDKVPASVKVDLDEWYLKNRSLALDMKIIFWTFIKVVKKEGVAH